MQTEQIITALQKHQGEFHAIVHFNKATEKLLKMDLSETNKAVDAVMVEDTKRFCNYFNELLFNTGCKYAVGGYAENRVNVYRRSVEYDGTKPGEERRTVHLGIDVWGTAGTEIYAPLGGMIHSFGFNNHAGDYGATIILLHQLEGIPFYTLYGHLCLKDIEQLKEGAYVNRGQRIAHFGEPHENGWWPPHLHFQIIMDMQMKKGDYPGVCKYSDREFYLNNCPDPDLVLQLNRYL